MVASQKLELEIISSVLVVPSTKDAMLLCGVVLEMITF
jgi:hypothetical protein